MSIMCIRDIFYQDGRHVIIVVIQKLITAIARFIRNDISILNLAVFSLFLYPKWPHVVIYIQL